MSTGELLSKFALRFKDPDLSRIYSREKTEFFSKAIPVVASMLLLLSGTLEVLYRVMNLGELPSYISLVNWIMFALILVISFLHTKLSILHKMVCPCLTTLIFLYMSFLDYDYTVASIYYS